MTAVDAAALACPLGKMIQSDQGPLMDATNILDTQATITT